VLVLAERSTLRVLVRLAAAQFIHDEEKRAADEARARQKRR
jgi:hypothetical protein